jgi:hypothetical protein
LDGGKGSLQTLRIGFNHIREILKGRHAYLLRFGTLEDLFLAALASSSLLILK